MGLGSMIKEILTEWFREGNIAFGIMLVLADWFLEGIQLGWKMICIVY